MTTERAQRLRNDRMDQTRRAVAGVLILLFLAICSQDLRAQELSPRQNDILKTTLNAEGWLTEDMHREFWAAVPADLKANAHFHELLRTVLDRLVGASLRFQVETWSSIKASLESRRVVKTSGFERAKSLLLSSASLPALRQKALEGAQSAERLIEAAASGKPVTLSNGTFYLTNELVARTLSGLEASACRFRRLSNATWDPKLFERTYSDVHVRILSFCPLQREISEVAGGSGKRTKLIQLSKVLSETEFVTIGFFELGGAWAAPEGSAIRTAQSSLQGMGISDSTPTTSPWRGRVSATASGSTRTSGGGVHAAIRVVEAKANRGAWSFVGMSTRSLMDALGRREMLELNTQLD